MSTSLRSEEALIRPTAAPPFEAAASPARTRRLLVISYHFPPDGAVGGLRWAGLSKYLARVGWEVHIVTAAEGPASVAPGVHRHLCRPRRTLNDRYKSLAGRLRRSRRGKVNEPAPSAPGPTAMPSAR